MIRSDSMVVFLRTTLSSSLYALRIEQLFELFFVFHEKSECESLPLVVTPKELPKPYKNTKPRNIDVSGFFDKKLLPLFYKLNLFRFKFII